MFQALDTFDATIVTPVYYVMFTTLTIIASAIMFKVGQSIHVSCILLVMYQNFSSVEHWYMKRLAVFFH